MDNFYNIIILSKTFQSKSYKVINEQIELINETLINHLNQDISFDYLIFDNTSLINNLNTSSIMCDGKIPITNFFHQTNLENIFFGNNIEEIIDSIVNNEIQ